ncbi:hypothetical protein PGT21_018029 [Puccinia graminis f. sp. tritici]|uniref:Uncharacterized protein n=1 Tax=Puccinia graminis f. sp. tritici TaxID=56615 RepID=A0A5B0MFF8_PUCGR|nr:hypothetical protein PGT21_018029 [Puccinia graminis f. sp. tritici]
MYRESLRNLENQRQMVDIERQRIQNQHLRNQVVSDLQSQEQELRLRRELELAGSGLYKYYAIRVDEVVQPRRPGFSVSRAYALCVLTVISKGLRGEEC